MTTQRERPPADVQLLLRQQAGFGCCKCGFPFFQYHHIVPWEIEEHHRPEDMMIVCPNHHDEITNGKVPQDEQRRWKLNPANLQAGHASGLLRINQQELKVNFGGSIFTETPIILMMFDDPIIELKRGPNQELLVSTKSYDENDCPVFEIKDNEWVTGAALPWDLYAKRLHVKLRLKKGNIAFEIDVRQYPLKIRGTFWKHGQWFQGTESLLLDQNNTKIISSNVSHCHIGISYS